MEQWNNATKHLCQSKEHCFNNLFLSDDESMACLTEGYHSISEEKVKYHHSMLLLLMWRHDDDHMATYELRSMWSWIIMQNEKNVSL